MQLKVRLHVTGPLPLGSTSDGAKVCSSPLYGATDTGPIARALGFQSRTGREITAQGKPQPPLLQPRMGRQIVAQRKAQLPVLSPEWGDR
jgi:hypothetical protein